MKEVRMFTCVHDIIRLPQNAWVADLLLRLDDC